MGGRFRPVWVAGFPGYWGGADTELDHLIDLLIRHGIEIHLVPMFAADPKMVQSALERGCMLHEYADDIFRDQLVICFCNQNFLSHLPAIMEHGRPARVIWFNCMTWLFEAEMRAHSEGWIDYFGFSSEYQKRCLTPLLSQIRSFSTFPYKPFFSIDRFEWRYRPWNGSYNIGRISRDNWSKFAPDTWRIFDRVLVPSTLEKKVFILGYGPNAVRAIGLPPAELNSQTWECNTISTTEFFRTVDTMIHKTGTSRESYCRVLVEAYAHGTVPIVESDYAFPELVIDGETGFMTSDSDEMSYLASMLSRNPAEHRRIAENGRHHLEEMISQEECWQGWREILL